MFTQGDGPVLRDHQLVWIPNSGQASPGSIDSLPSTGYQCAQGDFTCSTLEM